MSKTAFLRNFCIPQFSWDCTTLKRFLFSLSTNLKFIKSVYLKKNCKFKEIDYE